MQSLLRSNDIVMALSLVLLVLNVLNRLLKKLVKVRLGKLSSKRMLTKASSVVPVKLLAKYPVLLQDKALTLLLWAAQPQSVLEPCLVPVWALRLVLGVLLLVVPLAQLPHFFLSSWALTLSVRFKNSAMPA